MSSRGKDLSRSWVPDEIMSFPGLAALLGPGSCRWPDKVAFHFSLFNFHFSIFTFHLGHPEIGNPKV